MISNEKPTFQSLGKSNTSLFGAIKKHIRTFSGRKTKAWGASMVDLGLPCNGGWRLTNRVVAAPGFHQANKANIAPIRIVHIARGTQQSAKNT